MSRDAMKELLIVTRLTLLFRGFQKQDLCYLISMLEAQFLTALHCVPLNARRALVKQASKGLNCRNGGSGDLIPVVARGVCMKIPAC
jgi:hypothetical protein